MFDRLTRVRVSQVCECAATRAWLATRLAISASASTESDWWRGAMASELRGMYECEVRAATKKRWISLEGRGSHKCPWHSKWREAPRFRGMRHAAGHGGFAAVLIYFW